MKELKGWTRVTRGPQQDHKRNAKQQTTDIKMEDCHTNQGSTGKCVDAIEEMDEIIPVRADIAQVVAHRNSKAVFIKLHGSLTSECKTPVVLNKCSMQHRN